MTDKKFTGEKSAVLQRVVRELHAGFSGPVIDLAARIHASDRTVEGYLHFLHKLGMARIGSWKFQVGAGGAIALWKFGPGRHARKSAGIGRNGPIFVDRSRAALDVLEYIKRKDLAQQKEIAERTGYAYAAMPQIIAALKKDGLVRIAGWSRKSAHGMPHSPIPMYRAESGADAPKPKPIPRGQMNQYRKRTLTERFGAENAQRIMTSRSDGGPDAIVIDGVTVWRRRPAKKSSGAAA